jgi:hypothetical protein
MVDPGIYRFYLQFAAFLIGQSKSKSLCVFVGKNGFLVFDNSDFFPVPASGAPNVVVGTIKMVVFKQ